MSTFGLVTKGQRASSANERVEFKLETAVSADISEN